MNTDNWRPLSLVAQSTSNTIYALFVPLAVLGLAIQLNRDEQFILLPILLILGLFSALIGILQAIGKSNDLLYFYNITNYGAAVGLFANRNHQALLLSCLFPMLSVFASVRGGSVGQNKLKRSLAISAGITLVPLILITGSRAGLLLGLVGLVSALLLHLKSPQGRSSNRLVSRPVTFYALGALAVIALTAITVFFSRGLAIARLAETGARRDIWWQVVDIGSQYSPVGTGIGTFATIYQMYEPTEMLARVYTNHAHNEFLDLYLTCGLFGVAIVLIIIFTLTRAFREGNLNKAHSQMDKMFARLGAVMLSIIFIGSITDYPLRTPIVTALCIIAVVWLIPHLSCNVEKAGTK